MRNLFAELPAMNPEVGGNGVWTKADSVTMFDDFRYGRE